MIRVLIADDHTILAEGLRNLLHQKSGIEVVGTAADGPEAVRLACECLPDVVIMDVGLPILNGMEATRQIMEACPEVRVIALSMHADRRFVNGMIKAGARGYLLKDCAFEELRRAVETVSGNRVYLSPAIAGVVVDELQSFSIAEQPAGVLSKREREVLQSLAEGQSMRVIARRLHLSIKTVETHRRNIMEKLDLFSLAELTKYAVREGLTSLDD